MINRIVSEQQKTYADPINTDVAGDMNNYINTLARSKSLHKVKEILAFETIYHMESSGEQLSISILSDRTGFSRSFFYKNAAIRSFLESARSRQIGKPFSCNREKKATVALKDLFRLRSRERGELRNEISQLTSRIKLLSGDLQHYYSSISAEDK